MRILRPPMNAAHNAASLMQSRRLASTIIRARRGCIGRRSIARPTSVRPPALLLAKAPSERSSVSALATALGSGLSSQSNWVASLMPAACSISTDSDKSVRWISGVLCSDRLRWPLSVQSRWQVPAAVRPALPARWSAEARLISSINSVPKPRSASKRATRARPQSMTWRMPSMVIEVSATLVATTTLRRSFLAKARS